MPHHLHPRHGRHARHELHARHPLLRIPSEAFHHPPVQRRRIARVHGARRLSGLGRPLLAAVAAAAHGTPAPPRHERRFALVRERVDDRPERPDVAFGRRLGQLGRLPREGAAVAVGRVVRVRGDGGEAEVAELDVRVGRLPVVVGAEFQEDVGRLDVAVDDALPGRGGAGVGRVVLEAPAVVQEGEGLGHLGEGVPEEGFRDRGLVRRVLVDEVVQVAAVAVFQVEFRVVGEDAAVDERGDPLVGREHVSEDPNLDGQAAGNFDLGAGLEDQELAVAASPDEGAGALASLGEVLDFVIGLHLIKSRCPHAPRHPCG